MAAFATCKFPLVDEFKDYGEKNRLVGFIDSVLSGFGQIVLSDNPLTGLLVLLGVFLGSPSQMFVALFAACVGAAFAFWIGVNKVLIHHGLYTFSPAVVGLGVSLWGYSNQPVSVPLLICAAVSAVVSVLLTAAFGAFLSRWDAPPLSVPYCVTLMMVLPALLLANHMRPAPLLVPLLTPLTGAASPLDAASFLQASVAGIGEICFQAGVAPGICLLLGILISSRVDFIVALLCAAAGTGLAAALGLPTGNIIIGLYGYNAALVGMGLFGRAFRMSAASALFTLVMAFFSVFLTAAMGVMFSPLGIPVAALPFGVIVIACMMGKDGLSKLTPVSVLLWGVPETIEKALKAQDEHATQTT